MKETTPHSLETTPHPIETHTHNTHTKTNTRHQHTNTNENTPPQTHPTQTTGTTNAFPGMAGQPRTSDLRRPKPSPAPTKRNTKRGIRSKQKIAERIEKRTEKRRKARQRKRDLKPWLGHKVWSHKIQNAATAEKPTNRIKIGKGFRIATFNIKGVMEKGKRQQIENYMKKNNIKILALQETYIKQNTKEARKEYTWYFSGENQQNDSSWTAGVGFVISNDYVKYIEEIIPHTDRIMQLTLKGTLTINLINIYIPQAERPEEEKEKVYNTTDKITKQTIKKGPTYIMGDWNAKVRKARNKEERKAIGKLTFEPDKISIHKQSENVTWNRNKCIDFCLKYNLALSNTFFKKPIHKTATYRIIGATIGDPISDLTHNQIDYIAIQHRWKNSITNIESDSKANVTSDHYPLIATIKIKLKATHTQKGRGRKKYTQSSTEQKENNNKRLFEELINNNIRHIDVKNYTHNCTQALKEATKRLTTLTPKEKDTHLSEESQRLLMQRGHAIDKGNLKAYESLNKRFRKNIQDNQIKTITNTLENSLDTRDKWLGIRQLKTEYQPNTYARRTRDGKHIPHAQRAQKAADYFSKEQWGKKKRKQADTTLEGRERKEKVDHCKNTETDYDLSDITITEVKDVIKKFKDRKAPGPDEIPMEVFKEMDDKCIQEILKLINQWWKEEDIPEETLRARVVLIYKKGDTGLYENYRPISLLNSIYKIYAAIIQKRLSKTLDKYLQSTQYGFRKDKSTADAIQIIRRVAEHGQQTSNKLHMVLLDWEKAFDKVDRDKLMESLERMSVNKKYINIIKSLYKDTLFKIEIEGISSKWMAQETGIRQGCPLSPYLFLIVMTTMFIDAKKDIQTKLCTQRVPGADFDEVMYADDTILISESTKTMNLFIKQIEIKGREYGLKLNKTKCELLTTEQKPDIHFENKDKVTKKDEVKYLGISLNQTGDTRKELSQRISNAARTLQKLQIFLRISKCPVKFKIICLDAVVRSKLLYGIDSLQLNEPELKRLEKFHLQGLRKILKWDTTYINREKKNEKIYEEINNKLNEERTIARGKDSKKKKKNKTKNKTVMKFADAYKIRRTKRIEKTIQDKGTLNKITFDNKLNARIPPLRKPGRPKYKWADKAIEDYWKEVRKTYKFYNTTDYNTKDEKMKELFKIHASVSTPVPKEQWEKIENKETEYTEENRDINELALYTDGSCRDNNNNKVSTQPAGWGIAVVEGKVDENRKITREGRLIESLYGPVITDLKSKYFLGTEKASNNTGELTAICEGLLWLKDHETSNRPVAFYYDSKYAAKITTGEFRAKDNKHLAATARALLKTVLEKRKVRFEHVEGHSNDRWNDKADELANIGAEGKQSLKGRYEGSVPTTLTTEKRTENIDKRKESIRKTNEQRLANIRMEDKNKIHIPTPIYKTGSNRRSRFAFGNITQKEARKNTTTYIKERADAETIDVEHIPLTMQDKDLAERIIQEEKDNEEENIFFGEDEPNPNDCA